MSAWAVGSRWWWAWLGTSEQVGVCVTVALPRVSRRERSDKAHKGLRHFSLKVCQQVQNRGRTTYKEVR